MNADSLHPLVILYFSALSDLVITINISPVTCYWGAGQHTKGQEQLLTQHRGTPGVLCFCLLCRCKVQGFCLHKGETGFLPGRVQERCRFCLHKKPEHAQTPCCGIKLVSHLKKPGSVSARAALLIVSKMLIKSSAGFYL